MIEEWKDVKGYEGLYQISNFGRVKSFYTNKILKPAIEKSGYNQVSLVKQHKKKKYYIHRLVGLHFINNPSNLNEINHIDGDKSNNGIKNLEWCTRQDNVKHSVNVLHNQLGGTISVVCIETKETFNSITEAAKHYHRQPTNLSNMLSGKNRCKTFAGLHWKYA